MAIVSSTITKDINLGSNRRIEEAHTDSTGAVHIRLRFVPIGYDANADLAAHADLIATELAEAEADAEVNK